MTQRETVARITADKRPGESLAEYWGRKHDERHGAVCNCAWNRCRLTVPLPGASFDTVPEGKRLARR